MLPKSVSMRAQSPAAVALRRELDEQRRLLGGSRREPLERMGMPEKGRQFTEASSFAVRLITHPPVQK